MEGKLRKNDAEHQPLGDDYALHFFQVFPGDVADPLLHPSTTLGVSCLARLLSSGCDCRLVVHVHVLFQQDQLSRLLPDQVLRRDTAGRAVGALDVIS